MRAINAPNMNSLPPPARQWLYPYLYLLPAARVGPTRPEAETAAAPPPGPHPPPPVLRISAPYRPLVHLKAVQTSSSGSEGQNAPPPAEEFRPALARTLA